MLSLSCNKQLRYSMMLFRIKDINDIITAEDMGDDP